MYVVKQMYLRNKKDGHVNDFATFKFVCKNSFMYFLKQMYTLQTFQHQLIFLDLYKTKILQYYTNTNILFW
jgi:hypothetical protein